jgi:hypothetical protein
LILIGGVNPTGQPAGRVCRPPKDHERYTTVEITPGPRYPLERCYSFGVRKAAPDHSFGRQASGQAHSLGEVLSVTIKGDKRGRTKRPLEVLEDQVVSPDPEVLMADIDIAALPARRRQELDVDQPPPAIVNPHTRPAAAPEP